MLLNSKKQSHQNLLKTHPLLFYTKFQPGESLNSWIFRLAMRNKTSMKNFANILNLEIEPHDFDFNIPFQNWINIQNFMKSKKEIDYSMHGLLISKYVTKTTSHVYIPKIEKYYNHDIIYRYCPLCLNSDTPYHRAKWRFSFQVACKKHHCWLNSKCPRCNKIQNLKTIRKNNFSERKIKSAKYCIYCDNDLTKSVAAPIPSNISTNTIFQKQDLFWKVIEQKYINELVHITNINYLNKHNKYINHPILGYINLYIVDHMSQHSNIYLRLFRWNKELCYKKMFGKYAASLIAKHLEQN